MRPGAENAFFRRWGFGGTEKRIDMIFRKFPHLGFAGTMVHGNSVNAMEIADRKTAEG